MGNEFILKVKDNFKKGLDKSRVELATRNLFSKRVFEDSRCYKVKLNEQSHSIKENDLVLVCVLDCGKIVIMVELTDVGHFMDPPEAVVDALKESGREACGRIIAIHEVAGVAEVSIQ